MVTATTPHNLHLYPYPCPLAPPVSLTSRQPLPFLPSLHLKLASVSAAHLSVRGPLSVAVIWAGRAAVPGCSDYGSGSGAAPPC